MHQLFKYFFYLLAIGSIPLSSLAASNISHNQCIVEMQQGERTIYKDELDLRGCDLQDKDIPKVVIYLKDHPEINFALDLDNNKELSPQALMLLGDITTVNAISFDGSQLGDTAAETFAKANTTFHYVSFTDNQIGDRGATALANSNPITWLILNKNSITKIGARALANSVKLDTLDLTGNSELGDDGAAELAKSHLKILNLGHNNISNLGAYAFRNAQISELYLWDNSIGNEGAAYLSSNHNLDTLSLQSNKITDISSFKKNTSITYLNLKANQITDAGLEGLDQNQTLKLLFLSKNQLTNLGAFILANLNLIQLDVSYNHIGKEGIAKLKEKYGNAVDTEGNDGLKYINNAINGKSKTNGSKKRRWLYYTRDAR